MNQSIIPTVTASAFNLTIKLIYQAIPISEKLQQTVQCVSQHLYLAFPQVASFLAEPVQNRILIEKIHYWRKQL